jgi:transposase-like protein
VPRYPGTIEELLEWFPSEAACREYLKEIRWPNGATCPRCKSSNAWMMKSRPLFKCGDCRYQASILVGTIFQDTKLPLRKWFQAIWWFTNQKSGISATGLQRVLRLKRYATAWSILHKLRLAMVRPDRSRLRGEVEVDEFFLGGKDNKLTIGIAAQIDGKKTGRIRLERIRDVSGWSVRRFLARHIEPGSTIVTDGHAAYLNIYVDGYRHKRKGALAREGKPKGADEFLPRAHRVIALVKRWYYATYHGRIDPKHLNTYLNEFTFRFNRRTAESRGLLFYRALENALAIGPSPYAPTTTDSG